MIRQKQLFMFEGKESYFINRLEQYLSKVTDKVNDTKI